MDKAIDFINNIRYDGLDNSDMKAEEHMSEELLTPAEVAGLLGTAPRTITRWVDDGILPAVVTPGGHRRIPKSAVMEYRQKLNREGPRKVVIINQKGGVAKTTVTVNWAVLLAQSGARVLIVDLDTQGNSALSLGYDPDKLERTLYNSLLHPQDVPLVDVILHTRFGVDLVPLNLTASNMDVEFNSNPMWGLLLRTLLDTVRDAYDYILFDCGPNLGKTTVMGLLAANYVVIPTQPQKLSIHGLRMLLSRIEEAQAAGNPNLQVAGVLLTMVQGVQTDQAMEESLRKALDGSSRRALKVFAGSIPLRAAYKDVANDGEVMAALRPNSEATTYFRVTLAELLTVIGGATAPDAVAPRQKVAV